MNKTQALEAIENIQTIVKSNNRAFVSPKQMSSIGVLLLLVPLVELFLELTPLDTLLFDTFGVFGNSLPRMLFYGYFFYFIASMFKEDQSRSPHPLISKAFSIEYTFAFSCLAIGLGLGLAGHHELVYPSIFILLGILYNLLGKFINISFTRASWVFLIIAPFYMYLTKLGHTKLWMIFIVIHGLLTLYIAYYTKKYDCEES